MAAKTTGTLGKYRIIEEIGRGGFAAVYKAVDTELDREVALKVLAPHLLWDPTFIERFRREAKAMANLNHPNIATLYDYGEQEGSYFLVMEYVSGGTVRELVEREGPLPPEQVVPILEQVAAGLDYAHGRDVIHRDVKSSNVLLTPDGTAKLTDFGLVKVVAETSTLSSLGQSAGTPEYMAPEQFEGQEVGVHTDLYSLGVVLYEMCTGALPFTGPTPLAVMRGVVDKPPPDPSELNPSLPLALAKVLLRALAKKPQDRYSSATELAVALVEAVEGEKQRARRQQLTGLRREAEAALAAADWDRLTALCGEIEALAPGDAQAREWHARAQKEQAAAAARCQQSVGDQARQARVAQLVGAAESALAAQQWQKALGYCDEIETSVPDHANLEALRKRAATSMRANQQAAEQERQGAVEEEDRSECSQDETAPTIPWAPVLAGAAVVAVIIIGVVGERGCVFTPPTNSPTAVRLPATPTPRPATATRRPATATRVSSAASTDTPVPVASRAPDRGYASGPLPQQPPRGFWAGKGRVELVWEWSRVLQEDEVFDVRLWADWRTDIPFDTIQTRDTAIWLDPSGKPERVWWSVSVLQIGLGSDGTGYKRLSPDSQRRFISYW